MLKICLTSSNSVKAVKWQFMWIYDRTLFLLTSCLYCPVLHSFIFSTDAFFVQEWFYNDFFCIVVISSWYFSLFPHFLYFSNYVNLSNDLINLYLNPYFHRKWNEKIRGVQTFVLNHTVRNEADRITSYCRIEFHAMMKSW